MSPSPPVTLASLRRHKAEGRRFPCLTAYDATFARALDQAGIDVVLVGDSLGMVVQGEASTLPVTMDHMVYHTRAVARGLERALLMADLPFMACATVEWALTNAGRLMAEGGAQVVKLEGGGVQLEVVAALAARDIPVCAHLGLQPQAVHKLGGYRVQGRVPEAAEAMAAAARELEAAGADLLLLECVPRELAAGITAAAGVPVIGIGAGPECDGQVLVLHDLLGLSPRLPRFAKGYLEGGRDIPGAIAAYAEEVRAGAFPDPGHCY
jgi:3-methyl-2-oxobutanoate hydroxymethyltransferase